MKPLALLILAGSGLLVNSPVSALGGEVLKLEADGTAYCSGMAPIPLDPDHATFWLQVDSDQQFSVYLDAGLTEKAFTLPVTLEKLVSSTNKNGVVTDRYAINALLSVTESDNPGYLALNGSLKAKDGVVVWLKTQFIRNGLTNPCSDSGVMRGTPVM